MLTRAEIIAAVPYALQGVDDLSGFRSVQRGKVRDIYRYDDKLVLIATDRISAFDRVLGLIPYRGQVLNQLSVWWFQQTASIISNHVLTVPDPNVTIARIAEPLPVEVVVRGYITGVTSTALWTLYAQGERQPYGIHLPDGLQKNDPLPQPIITPTTKARDGQHDERISRAALIEGGLVPEAVWNQIENTAMALFAQGDAIARQAGLILVDTKYEFGLIDGQLTLIDEIHTPDSSRYWTMESYERGEPEHIDKEYLRQWFAQRGYRGDGAPPAMPDDFIAEVAARYIHVYERLTNETFKPGALPTAERIRQALHSM